MNFLCILSVMWLGAVELETQPAWESADNDYSTGGILADVDGDGDLDLVTGNGNDMDRDPNRVYYNEDDMLEETASWSSFDIACNGHISMGDMDADGDLDLAVAGFAYSSGWVSDPSRIYINDGGSFSTNPIWLVGDELHAFSCDWGDADGDGDLDLAIAAGNDYLYLEQKVKIFENIEGQLSDQPMWESDDIEYNMDVCWVDIDADGDLDLAAAGYINRIYFMEEETLNTQPGWTCNDTNATIQIAFADFDGDGDLDMAAADNKQPGAHRPGESRIRIYQNINGNLDSLPFWISKVWITQSCVSWGDVDYDGDLDLAAGGWWEPACIYENVSDSFSPFPTWSWSPSNPYDLVCEQLMWGEVDNNNWADTTENFGDVGAGRCIYPYRFPALDILEVRIGGSGASPGDYLWNPADGWIQINQPGEVEVTYRYSKFPDLVVTSWVPDRGNFAFLNLGEEDTADVFIERPIVAEMPRLEKTLIRRGDRVRLISPVDTGVQSISLYNVTGQRLHTIEIDQTENGTNLPIPTAILPRGVYLVRVTTEITTTTLRFQLI